MAAHSEKGGSGWGKPGRVISIKTPDLDIVRKTLKISNMKWIHERANDWKATFVHITNDFIIKNTMESFISYGHDIEIHTNLENSPHLCFWKN